jgi:hypothetical protein
MKELKILKTRYVTDERTGKKYPESNYQVANRNKSSRCKTYYVEEPVLKAYYLDIYGEEYVENLDW